MFRDLPHQFSARDKNGMRMERAPNTRVPRPREIFAWQKDGPGPRLELLK
jgi:hypothetical protein